MYTDSTLTNHLQTSSAIESKSKVIAEWNLNIFENMDVIGNYFYRPDTTSTKYVSDYLTLPTTFVLETADTPNPRYYGGTDYDVIIDGGYDVDGTTPVTFAKQNDRQKSLMSLESCFKRFRPRSGINKLRFNPNNKLPTSNETMYQRPRYYVAGKDDLFKYWSSYKEIVNPSDTTQTTAIGQSYKVGSDFYIEDVAPFIKYKNSIPANRIVVKVQTNIGDTKIPNATDDPFWSGSATNYKSTPLVWKVEKLVGNTWVEAYSTSSDVFPTDGYVELAYGITNIPVAYTNNFRLQGTISYLYKLPKLSAEDAGIAYLSKTSTDDIGTLYIWTGSAWTTVVPTYGWYLNTQTVNNSQQYVTDLIASTAESFVSGSTRVYRQFDYIDGLRISATKMKNIESTFDLIELSPRLVADISDITISYSVKKTASDIGLSGIPVGQLLASTGQLNIFDYNQAFNQNNQDSILNKYVSGTLQFSFISKNLQVKLYEVVSRVVQGDLTYKDYTIPIKTMYSDGFPQYNNASREVSFNLRDLYFYFESITAPQIMMQNAPMSSIIATLLDGIGFSNYIFKRGKDRNGNAEVDPVIPYFFVPPDRTIIQVLNDLAQSTQTAMFFDEDNNFVCMTKGFLMPEDDYVRTTNITLYGDDAAGGIKANIVDLKNENKEVYNDGKVVYRNRYIQKSITSLTQASQLDKDRRWRYKPVLLWEVSGEQATKSINEELSTQSNYVLGAMPLASKLTSLLPRFDTTTGSIVNNTIEFGDAVYYLTRYNGYFYANGEIIKYDAVQYNVPAQGSSVAISAQNIVPIAGTVTIVTSSAHGFKVGDTVSISAVIPTGYRGNYTVTAVPTQTSFSIKTTTTGNITTSGSVYKLGDVWVTSVEDYQKYFANLPLGGQMYPTGKVRIYVEPYWNADGTIDGARTFTDTNGAVKTGAVAKHGRGQFGTIITQHIAGVESASTSTWDSVNVEAIATDSQYLFNSTKNINTTTDTISVATTISAKPGSTTTQIKNYLSTLKYNIATKKYELSSDNIQASALVFQGQGFASGSSAASSISYIMKDLSTSESNFDTFGTRLRIIGTKTSTSSIQNPSGSAPIYTTTEDEKKYNVIGGSSGGIVFYKDDSNQGYYFEMMALTDSNPNTSGVTASGDIHNMFFYKLVTHEFKKTVNVSGTYNSTDETLEASANAAITSIAGLDKAVLGSYVWLSNQTTTTQSGYYAVIDAGSASSKWKLKKTKGVLKPVKLWSGFKSIITDDGQFTGQGRVAAEQNPTVYDLSVQAEASLSNGARKFYLYLNNSLIDVVSDSEPLKVIQNMGTFIRGSSRVMFENVFAINTKSGNENVVNNINSIFNSNNTNLTMNKYALSGVVQSAFLSGIKLDGQEPPKIYYEEFGTIMREVAYFNVRFEKAYPALYSTIAKTFSVNKGYIVSGYTDNAYGAEFLVFNATDTILALDATSGNYLRILGVSFTQESAHDLTVDEYYSKRSDLSYQDGSNLGVNPNVYKQQYIDIKNSRLTYGTKSFTIDSPYIQNYDSAYKLMDWLINKLKKPRQAIGIDVFGLPILQLGDLVQINYTCPGSDVLEVNPNSKFVVYSIEHSKNESGLSMLVYVSEVV